MFDRAASAGRRSVDIALPALKRWKPRRPTFILLDDPRPGDAGKLILALFERSEEFRHPVRLLVVNQSAPSDLNLTRDRESGRWVSELLAPRGEPITLPSTGLLTAREIRVIRWDMAPSQAPIRDDAAVEDFLRATRGNPLLVELGFQWLRERSLADMDEDALLRMRVRRVFDAVRVAGVDEAFLKVLAMATLAGGAPMAFVRAPSDPPGSAEGRSIREVFGFNLFGPRSWRVSIRMTPSISGRSCRRFAPKRSGGPLSAKCCATFPTTRQDP